MISGRRLKYEVESFVLAGTPALVGWLAVLTAILVLLAGLVLVITGANPPGERLDVVEAVWVSLMRTLDPGTMGSDRGWAFRSIMLVVTLLGILLVSTLIAIMNSAVTREYEKLQRGRSTVVEKGHVVILGWSEVVFAVLKELTEAARTRRMVVVVFADQDPIMMRDELMLNVGRSRNLRVHCRRGAPTNMNELARISVADANSVVVLARPEPGGADDHTLRVLMGLSRIDAEATRARAKPFQIAVELKSDQALPNVLLALGAVSQREAEAKPASRSTIDRNRVHVVKGDQLMARVIVQSSRQIGLSLVYSELLSFERNELYALQPGNGWAGVSTTSRPLSKTPSSSASCGTRNRFSSRRTP